MCLIGYLCVIDVINDTVTQTNNLITNYLKAVFSLSNNIAEGATHLLRISCFILLFSFSGCYFDYADINAKTIKDNLVLVYKNAIKHAEILVLAGASVSIILSYMEVVVETYDFITPESQLMGYVAILTALYPAFLFSKLAAYIKKYNYVFYGELPPILKTIFNATEVKRG